MSIKTESQALNAFLSSFPVDAAWGGWADAADASARATCQAAVDACSDSDLAAFLTSNAVSPYRLIGFKLGPQTYHALVSALGREESAAMESAAISEAGWNGEY